MEKSSKLNWLGMGLAFGTVVGAVGGIVATHCYHKRQTIHPEIILENVKTFFLAEGSIEGSWIEFSRHPLRKFAIEYDTYTGGITRKEDDQIVQYEFIADAHTGTVLDIYRV
ncbi:PepSY domain-containing protein [Vagococcus elongatus]|uniref:Peptidase n=1 Tax=Vagococcus elongatus TaxID=180344 RepID=A0A430AM55_9ENTE|nr:PepSY domain-containing protein [Vagococcus elongatus]RSU09179.1 peptidase [Vagococcus elongatus]